MSKTSASSGDAAAQALLRGDAPARRWLWLHLLLAWLPVWALFTTLMVTAHEIGVLHAALVGARTIGAAALLGLLVQRLTERFPWPRPLGPTFVAIHACAAAAYAGAWVGLTTTIESLFRGEWRIVTPPGVIPFLVLGAWLYFMVAGIAYAVRASERAARAEAAAATTQLAALRAQLNPHFLFNALHTVVQLIPAQPRLAAQAAEQVAALLRTVIEEDRDVVPLSEERAFVERYLAVEHIRFGERLLVSFDTHADVADALVPSFALQTLVENAVRHGATPRIDPTNIDISARIEDEVLLLTVSDTGNGASGAPLPGAEGTGLRRLTERLEALYGGRASLSIRSGRGEGFTATIVVPMERDDG